MKELLTRLKMRFLTKQFFMFLCVGAFNTLNGTVLSFVFSSFLNANLAFIAGYISSLILSYFINSIITFRAQTSIVGLFKYCIAYIPNFLIQNLVVLLFLNLLNLPKIVAYASAAVIGIPVTYMLMQCFAYKSKRLKK